MNKIEITTAGYGLSVKYSDIDLGFFLSKWQAKVLIDGLKQVLGQGIEVTGLEHLSASAPKFD